jgi:hypothetical protein
LAAAVKVAPSAEFGGDAITVVLDLAGEALAFVAGDETSVPATGLLEQADSQKMKPLMANATRILLLSWSSVSRISSLTI